MIAKRNPVGSTANVVKKDLMSWGANRHPNSDFCTEHSTMGFGPADPLAFTPEIPEWLRNDVIPEMQKAGRDGFWKINNDLFAVNDQIEGQLGHTLGGGKEKRRGGWQKGNWKHSRCAPKKGYHKPGEKEQTREYTKKRMLFGGIRHRGNEPSKSQSETKYGGAGRFHHNQNKKGTREINEPSNGQCETKNGSAWRYFDLVYPKGKKKRR